MAGLVVLAALNGCGDDSGGGQASPTPQRTLPGGPRPTVTPLTHAGIRLELSNGAAVSQIAMLSGARLSGPDDSRPTTYGPLQQSVAANGSATVEVPGLAPGVWVHRIGVQKTGQQQYRQSLVVDDPTVSAELEWTLFATVLTVNQSEDSGDHDCDETCTLRDAMKRAKHVKRPVLVVFDHQALGTPAEVQSTDQRIVIDSAGLTIDGTDEHGNPSPLDEFNERTYPVRIMLRGTRKALPQRGSERDCPCTQNYGGTLFTAARGISFIGLHVVREYPDLTKICCGNQTLIHMGEGSADARVDTCRLDGGGRALPDAVTPKGNTGRATSKDCVKPENTGSTAAHPIVVNNSELSYCLDRGVKVREDYLVLTDNWIHNNLRCALFSIVPQGNINAVGNIIEENGMNCPSGAPPNCDRQEITRPDAPQVSAQGDSTNFDLDGNIVRSGPFSGVYWQVGAEGTLTNSFVCGMRIMGVLSDRKSGKVENGLVRGSASVLNGRSGVEVRNNVGIDLGTADDPGSNAFAGNPDGSQVVNSLNKDDVLSAQGNEWESCYPPGANSSHCDLDSILAHDVLNNTNGPVAVDAANPLPHESNDPVTLASARPSAFTEGNLVSLKGTGFDAVSGLAGLTSDDCDKLGTTNTCAPLQGTCVEFLVDGNWLPAADVVGVTPTFVMVRAPFTCSAPTKARVRRAVLSGGEQVSNELTVCANQ